MVVLGGVAVSYERGTPVPVCVHTLTTTCECRCNPTGTPDVERDHPGLYLGSYGGPRGGAVSYERGIPVSEQLNLPPTGTPDVERDHHDARPVHLIITMIMWIRTSRFDLNISKREYYSAHTSSNALLKYALPP